MALYRTYKLYIYPFFTQTRYWGNKTSQKHIWNVVCPHQWTLMSKRPARTQQFTANPWSLHQLTSNYIKSWMRTAGIITSSHPFKNSQTIGYFLQRLLKTSTNPEQWFTWCSRRTPVANVTERWRMSRGSGGVWDITGLPLSWSRQSGVWESGWGEFASTDVIRSTETCGEESSFFPVLCLETAPWLPASCLSLRMPFKKFTECYSCSWAFSSGTRDIIHWCLFMSWGLKCIYQTFKGFYVL